MDRPIKHQLPQSSRYELVLKIASGGMASVYLGRLKGAAGFWKLRAIKRAHQHLAEDDGFRARLIEEAHLSARIVHPHVVAMQDVEEMDGELLLVMDYIEGASLAVLIRRLAARGDSLPPGVAVRIVLDVAHGLAAAHGLTAEDGEPLGLVHRDVSPQNVLVGLDGLTRITDFGIAKCVDSPTGVNTRTGALKGKISYMSPEYIKGRGLDARADVFALGVVLWECLAGRPLFNGENELQTLENVCKQPAPRVSEARPDLGPDLDDVVARALQKSPAARFGSMREFACELEERARYLANHVDVAREVATLVGKELEERRAQVKRAHAEEERTLEVSREEGTIDVSVAVTSHKLPFTELIETPAPMPEKKRPVAPMVLLVAVVVGVVIVGFALSRDRPSVVPPKEHRVVAAPPQPEPTPAPAKAGPAAPSTTSPSEHTAPPLAPRPPVRIPATKPSASAGRPDPNPYVDPR